jgi:hypothetical protein
MNPVELLDRALQRGAGSGHAPRTVRALVAIADEVTDALGSTRLGQAERDRIYARSLAMLEAAVDEQRRGWQDALRGRRAAPALIGGAALTIGAAAVGWALLHGRRHPGHAAAA